MQELTQAGVARGSLPGVRPFSMPKSMRSEQNVHFCATPRRAGSSRSISFCIALVAVGEVLLGDLEARLIGTGDVAIGAADADVVVDGDDAVGALARRGGRTDMHAGRVGAVLAADRHEGALHIRERAGFDVEHLAPLHRRRGGVGMPAGRGAGLAADAALEIGDHRPAGHVAPARRVILTLTRSALDPVASVRSSSIGTKAFMLGASKSLA